MPKHYRVNTDWQATYPDPIVVKEGDELWLNGKADEWDGCIWRWARNRTEDEGWIPGSLVRNLDDKHFANAAFSAVELSCIVGERLIVLDETHGWVLCMTKDGSKGWVPARNLTAD